MYVENIYCLPPIGAETRNTKLIRRMTIGNVIVYTFHVSTMLDTFANLRVSTSPVKIRNVGANIQTVL